MPRFLKRGAAAILVFAVLWYVWRWVARQERIILGQGRALSARESEDARSLGITAPEQIRVLEVEEVPVPGTRWMQALAARLGYRPEGIAGMCMDQGIYLRRSPRDTRAILAHELVHTVQYFRLHGKRPFLRRYLMECLVDGYGCSDLEQEAILRSRELLAGSL